MSGRTVLVAGGAGFIGSSVALHLTAQHADWDVVALDSLHRSGSELNLPRLRDGGVRFVHGDVREPEDLRAVGGFDALVECSAEPSVVTAGEGARSFVVKTNLLGAHNCLEEAARNGAQVVFLSTSRVYPLGALRALRYSEGETRLELSDEQRVPGASACGVAEHFPLAGPRTLYGASKLAAELLVAEYADGFGVRAVINRCGVVAGPWQMGKVDQGVFAQWVLCFHFRRPLSYIGFAGKQVRDLLHVADLAELIDEQLREPERWDGAVVNVGGGAHVSLSLREASALCEQITGNSVPIATDPRIRAGDVPIYISDCRQLSTRSAWAPRHGPRQILEDIHGWLCENETAVASALGHTRTAR